MELGTILSWLKADGETVVAGVATLASRRSNLRVPEDHVLNATIAFEETNLGNITGHLQLACQLRDNIEVACLLGVDAVSPNDRRHPV